MSHYKILVVEKDPDLAEIIASYLEESGFPCVLCLQNEESVNKQDAINAKIVILDWDTVNKTQSKWVSTFNLFRADIFCVWLFNSEEDLRSCPTIYKKQITLLKPFGLRNLCDLLEEYDPKEFKSFI